MRGMLSFIFDILTDPLGLPICALWEYIILLIINGIAYAVAYSIVGDMYSFSGISSSTAGKVLHWIIRFIVFVIIWAITYVVIVLVKWITAHWVIALSVLGGILLLTGVIAVVVIFNRKGDASQ